MEYIICDLLNLKLAKTHDGAKEAKNKKKKTNQKPNTQNRIHVSSVIFAKWSLFHVMKFYKFDEYIQSVWEKSCFDVSDKVEQKSWLNNCYRIIPTDWYKCCEYA